MKTTEQGKAAEARVGSYLKKLGYQIVELNWKTRLCEIDLIAQKDKVIYFVEVKYRANNNQGDGFEYITPKKQKQMEFAARLWCDNHEFMGDWRLMAAAVTGTDSSTIEFVEI